MILNPVWIAQENGDEKILNNMKRAVTTSVIRFVTLWYLTA